MAEQRDENGETRADRARRLAKEGYSNNSYKGSTDPFLDPETQREYDEK